MEGHYILRLTHPRRASEERVFLAPSDEAAALAGPHCCRSDLWPASTVWAVARYQPLTVGADGLPVSGACVANAIGSGVYR